MKINLKIDGLNELESSLLKASIKVEEFKKHIGFIVGEHVKGKARDIVSVDTGTLKNSITAVTNIGKNNTEIEVFATERYAVYMEFGAKPHFPPINAIKRWAEKKGMNPYIVARAIAKKGIVVPATHGKRERPFMITALQRSENDIIRMVKDSFLALISKIIG